MSIVVLGPQASPPACVQLSPDRKRSLQSRASMQLNRLLSTRAGGDACGPRAMILVLFSQLMRCVGFLLFVQKLQATALRTYLVGTTQPTLHLGITVGQRLECEM